jgi:hypothetical protein
LGIFKSPKITREDAFLIYSAWAFPIFIWAFINIFYQMPSYILRMTLSQVIGASAYTLAFALLESLVIFGLFFGLIYLLAWILPDRLLADHLVTVSSLLAWVASIVVMFIQGGQDELIGWGQSRSLAYLGLVVLLWLALYLALLFSPKFDKLARAFFSRVSVLTVLYVIIGALSVIIIVIRNI